jgi:hypothetical protein
MYRSDLRLDEPASSCLHLHQLAQRRTVAAGASPRTVTKWSSTFML